jgi:hypothetical protein
VRRYAPTEMNVEGTYMSQEFMECLLASWQQGLWFWHDDVAALMYRDLKGS